MISKVEALQRLKKKGVMVADDHSIVTILIPADISFETGLKDACQKLAEIGYESSFCVKQSGVKTLASGSRTDSEEDTAASFENAAEEVTDEELQSFMTVDEEDRFSLDDDGQFSLGFDF